MSQKPPPNPDDSQLGYEVPGEQRPSSAIPTEQELEQEAPTIRKLDFSPPPLAHDPYAALRHRDFILYVCGWFVSALTTQIQSAGLAWEVYDVTKSKVMLGWVAGAQVIPLFLLALPAGKIADTFDRRRIIALSMLGSLFCSIGLAFLSYREGALPWMFLLIGLNSACLVAGRPARSSMLPQLVPRHLFANAVTWNTSAFQISAISGPFLGGLLVFVSLENLGNVSICYAADAAGALFLGALILFVRLRPPEGPRQTIDRSVLAGFHFVWRNKPLLGTMTLDLFAVLLGGVAYLIPVFAQDILHVGPRGYGGLKAAESIGAFVMTMTLAHLPPMKHAGRNMLLAVAGFGGAILIFAVSRNYWLSFLMLMLLGVFDSISVVVRHTLVQVLTPDSMRGRVSAINNISIGASNELGGFRAGVSAALFGTVTAVVIGGAGTIITVVAISLFFPHLRRFGSLHDAKPVEDDPRRGFEPILKQRKPETAVPRG